MVTLIELAAFNFGASTLIVRLIFICAQIGDDFDPGRCNFSEFSLRRRVLHRLLVTATGLLSLAGALHDAQVSLSFISPRACILMLLLKLRRGLVSINSHAWPLVSVLRDSFCEGLGAACVGVYMIRVHCRFGSLLMSVHWRC